MVSKRKPQSLVIDFPVSDVRGDKRFIAADFDGVRLLNLYVVNGESLESEKYQYKLRFLQAVLQWLKQDIHNFPHYLVVGDMNIAPGNSDVHDPQEWKGRIMTSDAERSMIHQIQEIGLVDCHRLFHLNAEDSYTWWDYREGSFARNRGLRIDLIFASSRMAGGCLRCYVDKTARQQPKPSDHAPVVSIFDTEILTPSLQ